jgi:hypothetical protein
MAVKIFGHTVSTPAAVAIGVGSLGAIYFAYKQHAASTAAASATSPSAIDPLTGLPYSEDNTIDPLTGEAYLAEAQQYGSVSAAEAAVSGGGYGYGSSYGGYGTGSGLVGSAGVTTEVASGGYASNAAWAQAVTAGLTTIGYTSTDVSAALGMYLGSLPLTTLADGVSSASIVEAALAEYGPPPVGSFQIIMATGSGSTATGSGNSGTGTSTGTGSTTGTGTGTTTTTTPPPPAKGGPITVTPVNLHTTQVSATSVGVAWAAPTIPKGQGPLTGYTAEVYEASGASEGPSWTVPAGQLYANAGGLKAKTAYHLNVWCEPAQTGGPHASVSFTTT